MFETKIKPSYMAQTRSGLPQQGILDTDFSEDAFMLLAKGITTHLNITARIHHKPGFKAHIGIKLTHVAPPGTMNVIIERTLSGTNDPDKNRAHGFSRAELELQKKLMDKMWYLYGVTTDDSERDICIVILPGIMCSYSFKRDDEKMETFNPCLN